MRVRMGIHTGEPEIHDDDYVGIDVHRAARIAAVAHGGQVVLSERTRALLGDAFDCAPLGVHRLKDLREREKLFQLGLTAFPALRSLNASNLPAPPSRLVGRRAELGALQELLREHRLVTLTGPGGTGKTRLALEATAQCRDEFDDGVWWSSLAAVSDPELVLPTVAQTLGAQVPLAEHIDERRMLILLDNLEQVVGCAPAISALLAACPNLTLLVTSRSLLRLRAEREYPVGPLELDEAAELFAARAVRSEPLAAVRAICARVDALPLAIELAAARTRAFAPTELLERLDRRLALLTDGPVDAPDRHVTLRDTIEWSYELLGADEAEHFARLSVFAGSFGADAARAVCGTRLDTLESLIEQSLLVQLPSGRCFMLETIREFAAERLGPQPELQRRHAEHYVEVARSAGLMDDVRGPDAPRPDRHRPRQRAGGARLGSRHRRGGGRTPARHGARELLGHERAVEGMQRLRDLLALAPPSLPPELRALALRVCGAAFEMSGDSAGGRHYYELSLDQYRTNDDRRGVGIILGRLAQNALGQGEIDSARELAEESSRLVDEAGFVRGQAIAAQLFARIERIGGDQDRAAELLARSADLAAGSDFAWWQGITLSELAEIELERDRPAQAEERAREALAAFAQVGDRQNVVYLARRARRRRSAGRAPGACGKVVGRDRGRGVARADRRVGAGPGAGLAPRPCSSRPRVRRRARRGPDAGARRGHHVRHERLTPLPAPGIYRNQTVPLPVRRIVAACQPHAPSPRHPPPSSQSRPSLPPLRPRPSRRLRRRVSRCRCARRHGKGFEAMCRLAYIDHGTVPCLSLNTAKPRTCRFTPRSGAWLESTTGAAYAMAGQSISPHGKPGGNYVIASRRSRKDPPPCMQDPHAPKARAADSAGTASGVELAGSCTRRDVRLDQERVRAAVGQLRDADGVLEHARQRRPADRPVHGSPQPGVWCYKGQGAGLNDISGTERNSSNVYLTGSKRCHVSWSGGYEVYAAKRPATISYPAPAAWTPSPRSCGAPSRPSPSPTDEGDSHDNHDPFEDLNPQGASHVHT